MLDFTTHPFTHRQQNNTNYIQATHFTTIFAFPFYFSLTLFLFFSHSFSLRLFFFKRCQNTSIAIVYYYSAKCFFLYIIFICTIIRYSDGKIGIWLCHWIIHWLTNIFFFCSETSSSAAAKRYRNEYHERTTKIHLHKVHKKNHPEHILQIWMSKRRRYRYT